MCSRPGTPAGGAPRYIASLLISAPIRSTVSMLYFSTSFEIRSRSSWLTTVNTTRALSSAAFSRICSSSLSRRTRENSRICTGSLNCSVAARTIRSAVSPVASLMIMTVFICASISRESEYLREPLDLSCVEPDTMLVAVIEPELVAKPDRHRSLTHRAQGRAPGPRRGLCALAVAAETGRWLDDVVPVGDPCEPVPRIPLAAATHARQAAQLSVARGLVLTARAGAGLLAEPIRI